MSDAMNARVSHLVGVSAALGLLGSAPSSADTLSATVAATSSAATTAPDASAGLLDGALSDVGGELLPSGMELQLYGFADVGYRQFVLDARSPWRAFLPDNGSFVVGNLNLYLSSSFDAWRSLLEVRFLYLPNGSFSWDNIGAAYPETNTADPAENFRQLQWGGIEIERAWLSYELHPLLTIRAGQWLTPYGIWNVDHGSPTIIAVTRPHTVGEALFPERQVGIELSGALSSGAHRFGYHATLSNGRGPFAYYFDLDDNKAVGGRVFWESSVLGQLTVGASVYFGRSTSAKLQLVPDADRVIRRDALITSQYDELSLAGDLRWIWGDLTVQGEIITNQRKYTPAGRPRLARLPGFVPDETPWGAYALVAYRLPLFGLMPYFSAEYYNYWTDSLMLRSLTGYIAGINWRPHPRVTLKVEYQVYSFQSSESPFTQHDIGSFNTQAAWAF